MFKITQNEVITYDGYEFPLYWADELKQDRQEFVAQIIKLWTPIQGMDDKFHEVLYGRIEYRLENLEEAFESGWFKPGIDIAGVIYLEEDDLQTGLGQAIIESGNWMDVSMDFTQELYDEYLKIIDEIVA